MSEQKIDRHLVCRTVDGEAIIACRECNTTICEQGEDYKRHALARTKPLEEAGPLINDPSEYVDDELEFRQFICPGCGTLLENEVILAELEPIHDKELL